MRDPNRLYKFYTELQRIHIEYFPDLRFGQLMLLLQSALGDPFYWEEDEYLEKLRKYVGEE